MWTKENEQITFSGVYFLFNMYYAKNVILNRSAIKINNDNFKLM